MAIDVRPAEISVTALKQRLDVANDFEQLVANDKSWYVHYEHAFLLGTLIDSSLLQGTNTRRRNTIGTHAEMAPTGSRNRC